MTYNLYIDVLFFINLSMDFLLLITLGKVMKLDFSIVRILFGSVIGALWACFITVYPVLPELAEIIITYLGMSSLMVWVAFRVKKIRVLIQMVIGLYFCAVILGGMIYGFYEHTRAGYYLEQLIRGNTKEAIPIVIWLLLISGSYFAMKYLLLTVLEVRKRKNCLYQVKLHYQGKVRTVTALMDTGNHLREPISDKPVHVITYEACKQFCESITTLIYIPFQAVGTKKGLLPGIWLDAMELEQDGKIKIIEKPLIAIYRESLSVDGSYQMLLNADLE